jgi:formylglycine-generating enzyme required for sulfatase activity
VALSLPDPIPDNPLRWSGWKLYNSPNFYERLNLSFDANATNEQIEDHCRRLLVWWQKKLPLKNQPSNPVSQMLRVPMDEAPVCLVEARAALLDPEKRKEHDVELRAQASAAAIEELKKLISFAIGDKKLRKEDEDRLLAAGLSFGLSRQELLEVIDAELNRTDSVRVKIEPVAPPPPPPVAAPAARAASPVADNGGQRDPQSEFRRLLRMSRLCLDGEDMTDDQRDAMCNLGESLGLTGGEAEDLIDEYLEEVALQPPMPSAPATVRPAKAPVATPAARPAAAPPKPAAAAAPAAKVQMPVITPLSRAQERESFPNFTNQVGAEMYLITSGVFQMGNEGPDAQPNEGPVTQTGVTKFYLSRFPITNSQYERFDPSHASKRAPWADDDHPVVYVSALDAERFCEWLSRVDGKRYRLPTEAEWEYAARGVEGRVYPWGGEFDAPHFANFADSRCSLPWRDARVDDGWAQTSPVGSYPKGKSPFGIEDLSGNVFEWCLDCFDTYKGKEIVNPRGPRNNGKRVYRGGSWKSRVTSLRAASRHFNSQDYSSNDVGFRVVCECA